MACQAPRQQYGRVRGSATIAATNPTIDMRAMPRPVRVLLQTTLIAAAMAELVNENLLIVAPKGYEVGYRDKKKDSLITEWGPVGETVDNWTEMVTRPGLRGARNRTPPLRTKAGVSPRRFTPPWTSEPSNTDYVAAVDGRRDTLSFVPVWKPRSRGASPV